MGVLLKAVKKLKSETNGDFFLKSFYFSVRVPAFETGFLINIPEDTINDKIVAVKVRTEFNNKSEVLRKEKR